MMSWVSTLGTFFNSPWKVTWPQKERLTFLHHHFVREQLAVKLRGGSISSSDIGVSLNLWYPQSPPQVLIIFSRKTHGCWEKTILGNPPYLQLFSNICRLEDRMVGMMPGAGIPWEVWTNEEFWFGSWNIQIIFVIIKRGEIERICQQFGGLQLTVLLNAGASFD